MADVSDKKTVKVPLVLRKMLYAKTDIISLGSYGFDLVDGQNRSNIIVVKVVVILWYKAATSFICIVRCSIRNSN